MKQCKIIGHAVLIISILVLSGCNRRTSHSAKKPNIILILSDQQSASMMSCTGNQWLKTPAMDYIAENGIRFTRAYTTNPVCSPARVSLITGRFSGAFRDNNGNQVRENGGSMRIPQISDEVKNSTVAAFMKKAGYELVYGGKEHLPGPLKPVELGFKDISDNERSELADEAAKYITQKGVTKEGAPVLVRLISAIASRFGIIVSEKVAAMAIPAIGAVGGAMVNTFFIDHFQNMARGHFIIRKLERKYGLESVKDKYMHF